MKQNMQVGTRINIASNQTDNGTIEKYCYDDTSTNCTDNHPNYPDGGLYQWDEAMQYSTTEGAQGICPSGWHIPTHDDFTTLERAVATSSTRFSDFPYDTTTINLLRGTHEGTTLTPNGTSGFEGNLAGLAGLAFIRGQNSYLLSSTELNGNVLQRRLSSTFTQVGRYAYNKTDGVSVRCLKDTPTTGISGTLDSNASLENGLVGHWTFDGDKINLASTTLEILDSSGQGNHGNWIQHSTSTVSGVLGQAIEFDGIAPSGDLINVSTNGMDFDNGTGSFSYAMWVKIDNLLAGGAGGSQIRTIQMSYCTAPSAYWFANISTTTMSVGTSLVDSNGVGKYHTSLANVWRAGEWFHVVGIINRTTNVVVQYVNGVQSSNAEDISTLTGTIDCNPVTTSASIGAQMAGGQFHFDGFMDDVRIYDRALSAEEAKRLYQLGATTKVAQTLSNPTLDNGLIGHWTFDGSDVDWSSTTAEIRDRSGNNYHGNATTTMTATSSPTRGVLGQALYFSSTSLNYITIPDSVALSGGAGKSISIAAWVKLSTTSQQRVVVRKWLNGSDKDWELNYEGTGENNFRFWTENAGGNAYCHATGTTIVAGQWYHAAATFDGPTKTCRVYVDGTLGVEEVELYDMPDTAANVEIGGEGYQRNDGYNMDGSIDDVRVYNRALSATEVKRLYDLGR
jgi:uncharacterized protein (TIGR02145 family)